MTKTAIILFNLGGPDNQKAVKPFLFNLFNDKAIIRLPQPLRFMIAKLISSRREKTAQAIYQKLGGGSPILPNTEQQARALERALGDEFKCFIAMRCWHPMVEQTIAQVKDFAPDRIVLLPLYPQFSTTTSASSLESWHKVARKAGLKASTQTICCYPDQSGFIRSLATLTAAAYRQALAHGTPRILFSAHGLPESIVRAGDPYQWQCEQTVAALRKELAIDGLDSVLCYQSRVGPMKWIGPATDDEIRRAASHKKPLVVVPIAFVSEHSETLVELDIEYRELALHNGCPGFFYTGTVSTDKIFITGLADMIRATLTKNIAYTADKTTRICPKEFSGCCQNMGN